MSISDTTTTTAGVVPAGLARDRIIYGAVHLEVVDLERSLRFWRDLIGLGELPSDAGETRLGVDGRTLIVLRADAVRPVARGDAGLYHVAIHLPDATEFARVLMRLAQARYPQSPTDHVFSKATYLNDPDGILLEMTLETPERFGSLEVTPTAITFIDSDGRPRRGTEPLDVGEALAPLADGDPHGPLPSGTYVGHVHLHVDDIEKGYRFYRDVIGFEEHSFMAMIGMADLSAGGPFPHRMAINNWHGPNARQPAPGTAGMNRYEIILRGDGQLARLAERAAVAGVDVTSATAGVLRLQDPAGNQIVAIEAAA